MKKITLIVAMLWFMVGGIYAQEQRDHPQKWHVGDDGNFYINKNLGVYLRIATSPEKDAETHLLKSKTSEAYTNPMYLDTEGYNTIRSPWAVDPETKKTVVPQQDVIFEVYADGVAPKTLAEFQNAPRYVKNSKIYYGKGLRVVLESDDAVSGVEKIFYSLNGEAYQEYTGELELSAADANDYTIKYYAVDFVGNAEAPTEKSFILDEDAPVATSEVLGKKVGNRISPDSKLKITTSDDYAGIKQVKYMLDDGEAKVYNGPISVKHLSGGEHTLEVYAVDNVDNSSMRDVLDDDEDEGGSSLNFEMDNAAPTVELNIQGDMHDAKYTYISERTKVEIVAEDEQSDVKAVYYGINEKADANPYNQPFKIETDKGLQYIRYGAVDALDNSSGSREKAVFMDNVSPVSAIDYKRPQFFNRDTLFVTENTDIEIFSKDYESGIKRIEYAIDGADYQEFESNITVAEPGYHTIKFRAIDQVNNTEKVKKSNFFVDNTPPHIYANFSIEPIGREEYEGETYKIYPTYVKLYLGATDKSAGAETIHYSINGGEMKKYADKGNIDVSEARLLKKEGFYNVKILSEDKLGNEQTKMVKFFVRED